LIILDTGVLVAAAHAEDIWYEQAVEILERHEPVDLILPAPVVPETAWMIGSRLDPATEAAFVGSVADGDFNLVDLVNDDWQRAARLIG
jgi:predicted nucleic acid-binding protein